MRHVLRAALAAAAWLLLAPAPALAAPQLPEIRYTDHLEPLRSGDALQIPELGGGVACLQADNSGTLQTTTCHSGTVISVGVSSTDSSITVTGSPITASGTINLSVAKWATARTLTLSGDVSGSQSFDGSADFSLATMIGANKVTLGDIAQIGANTVLGNATGSTGNVAAQSMPSCHGAASALIWTPATGFGCNTISSGSGVGGLVGIQRITATGAGTYTPDAGTSSVIIYLQGAGGGSSGIASPGSGKVSLGRAAGAGATIRVRLTSNFSGASYSVGAHGGGGSSGDNAGSNGGDTTFTATGGGGTVYTAGGGLGGNNGGSGLASFPTFSNAVAGGTATNGDVKINGQYSLFGLALTSVLALGGGGGNTPFGQGGVGTGLFSANTSGAGGAGQGFGTGGGAPSATGTGSAQAGSNGADGYIEIWEFN